MDEWEHVRKTLEARKKISVGKAICLLNEVEILRTGLEQERRATGKAIARGADAEATNTRLTAELAEARGAEKRGQHRIDCLLSWVRDLQSGMYINCVYCGHRYGPDSEVPASMAEVLKAHIEKCPEHPMSELRTQLTTAEAEIVRLKAELKTANRELVVRRAPWDCADCCSPESECDDCENYSAFEKGPETDSDGYPIAVETKDPHPDTEG
jgi:hypothetical protein